MVHRVLDPWMGLYRLQLDFRIQISFQNEKKKERKDVEMHFKCDFSLLRIQTLSQSHPCRPLAIVSLTLIMLITFDFTGPSLASQSLL